MLVSQPNIELVLYVSPRDPKGWLRSEENVRIYSRFLSGTPFCIKKNELENKKKRGLIVTVPSSYKNL
jgi:hypothetical protein